MWLFKGLHRALITGPDGKQLASGSSDRTIVIRSIVVKEQTNVYAGEQLLTLTGHRSEVTSVAFSPDGKRLASASRDRTLKLWDAFTGEELMTFDEHTDEISQVAFSPDGKSLASASSDKTVRLWDTSSGENTLTLEGHTREVRTVAFSPNGQQLASGGLDGMAKVWDAATGQETLSWQAYPTMGPGAFGGISGVVFSFDKNRLYTTSLTTDGKIWDLTRVAKKLARP